MFFVHVPVDGILQLGLVVVFVISESPGTFEHETALDPIFVLAAGYFVSILSFVNFVLTCFVILIPHSARGA